MKDSKLNIKLEPSKYPFLVQVITQELYWIDKSISDEELNRRMQKDCLEVYDFVVVNGKVEHQEYEIKIPNDLLRQDQIYLSIHPRMQKAYAEKVLKQARYRAEKSKGYDEEIKTRRFRFYVYPVIFALFMCFMDATSNYTEFGIKDYLMTVAFCFVLGAGFFNMSVNWEKECLEDLKYQL